VGQRIADVDIDRDSPVNGLPAVEGYATAVTKRRARRVKDGVMRSFAMFACAGVCGGLAAMASCLSGSGPDSTGSGAPALGLSPEEAVARSEKAQPDVIRILEGQLANA